MTPTAETTIKDVRNGYVAFMSARPGVNFAAYPIFEMALFRQASRDALLVVTCTRSDSVQMEHDTFFLRKRGEEWISVRGRSVAEISARNVFRRPEARADLDATCN